MGVLLSFIRYKICSIFDKKKHFSAVVLNSSLDPMSAVRPNCRVYDSSLGRYSYVARNSLIQHTQIGKFCSISEGCNIGMPMHPTNLISTSPVFLKGSNYLHKNFSSIEFEDCPTTYIGNDVWIGANAMIKSGIQIGNGCIIAAGAVVTKNLPSYAIAGGIPAKIIRYRFTEEKIKEIEQLKWWDWSDKKLTDDSDKLFSYVSDYEKE